MDDLKKFNKTPLPEKNKLLQSLILLILLMQIGCLQK